MSDFWAQQFSGTLIFLAVLMLIALSNLWALRQLGDYPLPSRWPRVSILVPARDEETNIGPCVRSLLAQAYPDFEVLVLDDHSNDGTARALADLTTEGGQLKVLKGSPLPAGWLGKHWACYQLAQVADGELLLFTDADTRHHPYMLCNAVAALLAEDADLLTALPQQEIVSWAEQLLVPIIPWSIFVVLPLGLAHCLRLPVLSVAIGQFMLFRRRAYEQVGGHAAVKGNIVDDIALGRKIKAHGLCWRLVDGSRYIRCRMYHNFQEVYNGLSKNLFAVFNSNVPLFILIWLWLGLVFLEPLLVLTWGVIGGRLPAWPLAQLASISVTGSLLLWAITYWRFGFPLYLAPLYPVTILLAILVAMRSKALTLTGQATWKGRTLFRRESH
mgnify:CR=1 FL=1